jgi:phosphohistidine phosphatase
MWRIFCRVWIHLLRHGIAIDRADPSCPTDPDRFLTEKGKAKTTAACRGWATTGVEIDLVCVSPYLRAQQTADIAVEVLGLQESERVTVDALVPMGEPASVVEFLRGRAAESVLCVGHAPNLDEVIAFLVGSDEAVTSLKKSGVATIDAHTVGHGGGSLFAVHPPAILRQLGE